MPRNTAPVLFLVVFGGVFALLGALTLSIVLTSVLERDDLIVSNIPFLVAAAGFLAAGAWIFGTALRMPFLRHPLGEPELRIGPTSVKQGHSVTARVRVTPVETVDLEEAFLVLYAVVVVVRGRGWGEKTSRVILHSERVELALPSGGGRLAPRVGADLGAEVRVPPGSEPTTAEGGRFVGWALRVQIVCRQGPDWVREEPVTVVSA